MDVRTVNLVCSEVFRRAAVGGPSAHPHTFRHTAIKMLWMKGNSFEQIAKWIGHRKSSTTANQYGRLSLSDVSARMTGMDWMGDQQDGDAVAEWTKLGRFLYEPYPFNTSDWPDRQRQADRPKRRRDQQTVEQERAPQTA